MTQIKSYKDLIVWQKSMEAVTEIYKITSFFPDTEKYGLCAQMRRSAISIPSNIAEGRRRGSRKDFRQFLTIAYGSGAELETQIEIAKRLSFGQKSDYIKIDKTLEEIMKILNKIIRTLQATN